MRMVSVCVLVVLTLACRASAPANTGPASLPPLRLDFVPESDQFAAATREYERLWDAEGERIVRAMTEVSGLRTRDTAVRVIVFEGVSMSGFRESPMRMRASYPPDTKKATLVHELGHRWMSGLFRRDEEEHGPLFLWLYDVWVRLWGQQFADEQVAVEKRRRGPYPKAWDDALALTAEQRAARWRSILAERLPTRR